jgi:p-hydroxybenzoate 3-monooxygenase
MHTQVAIVGGGPAGLLLGQLLHLKGIESVVLKRRDHEYVIDRVRAGVLDQFTADLMTAIGVAIACAKRACAMTTSTSASAASAI